MTNQPHEVTFQLQGVVGMSSSQLDRAVFVSGHTDKYGKWNEARFILSLAGNGEYVMTGDVAEESFAELALTISRRDSISKWFDATRDLVGVVGI